jgi:transcriptional regulator with XRE-family HTH domain
MSDDDELRERVALAIQKVGESNDILSEALGVSRNTISAYRNKKGDPKGTALSKLVSVYGFNPAWLLSGEGSMKGAHTPRPDEKLLSRCIAAVEAALDDADLELNPAGKAEFILLLYQEQARAPEPAAKRLVSIFGR